jgi:hypothetical protein
MSLKPSIGFQAGSGVSGAFLAWASQSTLAPEDRTAAAQRSALAAT